MGEAPERGRCPFFVRWATALLPCVLLLAPLPRAQADIYRFVTIDGVESFTDAPVRGDARLVMREPAKGRRKGGKNAVSLDEVVARTVEAARDGGKDSHHPLSLPPVGGVITSGVGMRIDPMDGRYRQHNGIDIAIGEGTAVTPVNEGTVIYSGQRGGYGKTVVIDHGNGMVTLYAHNSRLLVAEGQTVSAGSAIALSGNSGRSTGPHLHFEAWQGGVNVTGAFMPGSSGQLPRLASGGNRSRFRREVLADGSVLFTNIPSRLR